MIKGIFAVWSFIKWLNAFRKQVGTNTEAYCTKERALRWRFKGEKWARAIADGNLEGLPKFVRWIFSLTTADKALAKFFQYLLKSDKLEKNSPSLYRTH